MEQTKRHSEIRKQKARIKTSPKGPSAPVSVCCYELYMLTFVLFIELDQIIFIIITIDIKLACLGIDSEKFGSK